MIRFVRMRGQIVEGDNEFAWFDTVTDKFLEFNGTHVWDKWDEFEQDFQDTYYDPKYKEQKLARFKGLYCAEIAQSRAQDSNPEDLVSKPVSAPPQGDGKYHEGYKEGYSKGYYKGYEIGKEHQRTAMQEGKVTYARIT